MEFKKIFSGSVLRTTSSEPYYFNRCEISVYVTYNAVTLDAVEEEFKKSIPLLKPKQIGNKAVMAKVTSPESGIAIIMNISNEDKSCVDLACERLRAIFFRSIREYSSELGLTPEYTEEEWLRLRYFDMYKDAADLLTFELAG